MLNGSMEDDGGIRSTGIVCYMHVVSSFCKYICMDVYSLMSLAPSVQTCLFWTSLVRSY